MEETVAISGRLEYSSGDVTLYVGGENLAKEEYLNVQGYPSPEASWVAGMKIFF